MSLVCLAGTSNAQVTNNLHSDLPCVEKNFNLRIVMTVDSASLQPLLNQHQIDAILAEASTYFEPICMSFASCDKEVINNYSYNKLDTDFRVREAGVLFAYPRRINVFFVNEIKFTGDCGFSYNDGFDTERQAQIFIELSSSNCGDGPAEQLAHHMGKLLGLLPTNYGAELELVDGSNCTEAGDRICDTPADPYNDELLEKDEYFNVGCEFVWEKKDANGDYYLPSMTNIMSPYNCKCNFSFEQYQLMAENYNKAQRKNY